MSKNEITNVRTYFLTCLQVEKLDGVTPDELLAVLEPENPIERIMYRKEVAK